MTHHSVMTSKIEIFDFLSDIDYISKTDIFRDVIYLRINQCEPRRPKSTYLITQTRF